MEPGLGPAIAFLYFGPAINVLAIILTARILGWELGIARAVGAVLFSVVIGLLMHLIFLKEERERRRERTSISAIQRGPFPGQDNPLFLFDGRNPRLCELGKPPEESHNLWWLIYQYKWWITGFFAVLWQSCS